MNKKLLDTIKEEQNIETDVALGRFLDVHPPEISKIRKGERKIGASLILRIYDRCGMSIERIRCLINKK